MGLGWIKLFQERLQGVPADLIRTVAIVGVILLHAANETLGPSVNQMDILRWWMIDIYQTLGRVGVPLFVMLTGALLLQPSKIEPLNAFFKKRWVRIGLPFLFWGAIYFAWDYFADNIALTQSFLVQGILSGPYFQFWYLYMLVGLYLFTPVLRVVVANVNRETFKYFLAIWFLASIITPIPGLLGAFHLDSNLLMIPGWIGYFMLGVYLLTVKVRRWVLFSVLTLSLVLTAVGTYFMAYNIGGVETYYFQDYFSPTTILASVTLFLLLNTIRGPSNQSADAHPKSNWFLKLIGQSTLAIFLFHVIVLETLQRGYLWGFTISQNTINGVFEVPLITIVTLFICLGIILPLRKVPVINRLIG